MNGNVIVYAGRSRTGRGEKEPKNGMEAVSVKYVEFFARQELLRRRFNMGPPGTKWPTDASTADPRTEADAKPGVGQQEEPDNAGKEPDNRAGKEPDKSRAARS